MLKASVRRSPDSHLVPTKRVVVEPEICPPVASQGAAVARSAASPSISCQYRCQNRRRDETGSWWTSSGQALIGRQEPGAGVGFRLPRAEWPLAFQKTFSAPNMDDYGGPGQKPITSVIAGAPLGFEPAAVRSSPVRCGSSHYVYIFIIHGAGWLMASLFLLFAFFFGLTVMQISPA